MTRIERQRKNARRRGILAAMVSVLAAGLFGVGAVVGYGDWPQYRGGSHDGVSADRIVQEWPLTGPRQLWKKPLNSGFSSFAVSQGRAFTLVRRMVDDQDQEVCLALDTETGNELWATPIDAASYINGGTGTGDGDGPRSTPTVDGDRVYVFSCNLKLACLEASTGNSIWSLDLTRSPYNGRNINWQNAASPLIDGDLIFVNCNGSANNLLGLRKTDGTQVWRRYSDKMTHATPVATTILGVRQIIFYTQPGLVAVVPETGVELWRYNFRYNETSAAASAVVADDIVFCSAAYNSGAGAVRITKSGSTFTATELWRFTGSSMGNHWSTPVAYNGYFYGLFGDSGSARLKCIEAATGTATWPEGVAGFGPGGILVVDGKLLILGTTGEIVLAEPNPTAYTEIARAKILSQYCWNSPAISNGRIYARGTSEGVCLDVAAKALSPLRLQMLANPASGSFELGIGTVDGTSIDPPRTEKIEVMSATDLSIQTANWTKFTVPARLTNGMLWFAEPPGPLLPQQYFSVTEKP